MGPGAPMPWQALEAGHSRPLELDVDVPSTPESLLLGGEEFGRNPAPPDHGGRKIGR